MSETPIITPVKLIIRKPYKDFYKTFLNLITAASNTKLSDLEKELIEECYLFGNGVFDTECRKHIRERLAISVDNLNNYIGKLRAKSFIDADNKLSPMLNSPYLKYPETLPEGKIQIVFTLMAPKEVNQNPPNNG